MTNTKDSAIKYFESHQQVFLENLMDFLHIPSISTASEHKQDIQTAAEWTAAYMQTIGLKNARIFPTKLHPLVYAENLDAGEKAPTLLIYGHYDVQPVEPLQDWITPPFDPTVRADNLYARGATDMKGQVMAALSAIECILQQGNAPVNLKVILEGEEEIGSPSLDSFLKEYKDLLKSDIVLNLDAGMLGADLPTLKYGLRGIASFELRVYGPKIDLHSGSYGGVVLNPAQALVELLAGMHTADGQINLPGFYDSVPALGEEERKELARLPLDEEFYLNQTGVPALWGEKEFAAVERVGARPTLEINGILSGYTGEGGKTVIPTHSMAKITTRLVPNQKPGEVHRQLRQYLEENAPASITWELDYLGGGDPFIADLNLPQSQAFIKALEDVWGKKPLFAREGGSIPVAAAMKQILGAESILSGFGLPDDHPHAPNEKLHLPTWKKGIRSIIHFLYYLGES